MDNYNDFAIYCAQHRVTFTQKVRLLWAILREDDGVIQEVKNEVDSNNWYLHTKRRK